jgi:hypothetical protein
MFVPVILGSDKTTVSVATGHNEYYPLYISPGNVHNNVRRAHREAVTILAFLALPKSMSSVPSQPECDTDATYSVQRIVNFRMTMAFVGSADSCFIRRLRLFYNL